MAMHAKNKLNHYVAASIACSPFAMLQLLFLSDPGGLGFLLFGYGIIWPVGLGVAFLWCVYLVAEILWRNKTSTGSGVPHFSFVGGVLLAGFFIPALLLRPVLEAVPSFCRATQVTRWNTSRGKFILVAVGTGTVNQYRFNGGYLNWTGDGRAGFSSLRLQPMEFQYDYYEPYHSGSMELLRNRIAESGILNSEINSVSRDMWSVLQQAATGREVKSSQGISDHVESHVADNWDAKIGGMIWLIALLVAFLIASRFTVYPTNTALRSD